jgi:DNA-binding NtrC family response regulator
MQPVIVLVEDDDTFRDALTRQLRAKGYGVIPLATLNDARAVLDLVDPAAIVADLRLGEDRTTEILGRRETMSKVVLISGFDEAQQTADRYGLPFVRKPFDIDALVAHLPSP